MTILNGINNRNCNTLKRRKIDNKHYILICTSTITSITKLIMIICEQHDKILLLAISNSTYIY